MQSFISDNPGTKGAVLFKMYRNRIDWIFNDLFTNPNFSEQVRQGIKNEVNSDVWAIDAIVEKIALLKPEQRELLEDVIDKVIKGDELIVNETVG